MGVTTSLNHDRDGKACYDAERNQRGHAMRSRKLAALQQTLQPPKVHGPAEGDLLLVGWGSTRGSIEEAVDTARDEGLRVSSVHVQFLSPLPPGLNEIFRRFRKVITVELNYSDEWTDPLITEENRRYGQLAWLLRAATLLDIDCFAKVPGRPYMPVEIFDEIKRILEAQPSAKVGLERPASPRKEDTDDSRAS
jgi:2-oxoglutarate ferredoxin oxidoreductase subunit alpha